MTLILDDITRTTIGFTLGDGTICQNIFHHYYTGITGITDATALIRLEEWTEDMYAEIAGMVKNDVSVNLCQVDVVAFVVDQWEVSRNVGTFAPAFTPTGTAEMLPNMDSAFVTFKTLRPRSVGRKFVLPFEEAWQAGSYLVAGAVTDMVAWADDALADIYLGPVNDLHPGIIRTGVDQFLEFTLAIVTNVLGTQRRRRPGVGA